MAGNDAQDQLVEAGNTNEPYLKDIFLADPRHVNKWLTYFFFLSFTTGVL